MLIDFYANAICISPHQSRCQCQDPRSNTSTGTISPPTASGAVAASCSTYPEPPIHTLFPEPKPSLKCLEKLAILLLFPPGLQDSACLRGEQRRGAGPVPAEGPGISRRATSALPEPLAAPEQPLPRSPSRLQPHVAPALLFLY